MSWADVTRGGYAYRIHADDGRRGTTLLGAVDVGNGWCPCEWFKTDGTATYAQKVKGDLDLVEAPKPMAVPDEVLDAAITSLGIEPEGLEDALSAALSAWEKVRPTDGKPGIDVLASEVDMEG